MAKNRSFHDYLLYDVFREIPGITTKSMFSGWGIYLDRKIFGLIIDGELYFKLGKHKQKDFQQLGSHPFTYIRQGKEVALSYWTLPEEILNDPDLLLEWINTSIGE